MTTAKVWRIKGGEALATFRYDGQFSARAKELGDGKRILLWAWSSPEVKIWPISGGEATATFHHEGGVQGVRILSSGKQILTWGFFGKVKIWSVTGGEAIATFLHDGLDRLELLSDGKRILSWGADGMVKIWDISVDLDTPVEEQIRQYEIRTGTTLNASGRVRDLSVEEWETRIDNSRSRYH